MAESLIFGKDIKLPTVPGIESTCEKELQHLLLIVDQLLEQKIGKVKAELDHVKLENQALKNENENLRQQIAKLEEKSPCSSCETNEAEFDRKILVCKKIINELQKRLDTKAEKLRIEVTKRKLCDETIRLLRAAGHPKVNRDEEKVTSLLERISSEHTKYLEECVANKESALKTAREEVDIVIRRLNEQVLEWKG